MNSEGREEFIKAVIADDGAMWKGYFIVGIDVRRRNRFNIGFL